MDHAFARQTGRAWIRIRLAEPAPSGLNLATAFQNLMASDPLDQALLFTASTDIHAIGARLVGAVPTTEYAGTYRPSVALAELAPAQRALLGSMLRQMGATPARFRVGIDDQHLIRKMVDTQTISGLRTTTALIVTSVNKRITVPLPSPRQIAALPKP